MYANRTSRYTNNDRSDNTSLLWRSLDTDRTSGPTLTTLRDDPPSPDYRLDASTTPVQESRFQYDFSRVTARSQPHMQRDSAFTTAPALAAQNSLPHASRQDRENKAEIRRHERTADIDTSVDDPGFLLCLALCELGIPPAMWRTIVSEFLEAVWRAYREQYGAAKGDSEFRAFRTAFRAYTPLRVVKTILTFAVHGKVSLLTFRGPVATRLRQTLMKRLIALGVREAGIIAAEQILRKVTIVIEAAVAAGCVGYCGTMAYARMILSLTDAIAQGIATTAEVLEIGGKVARSVVEGVFLFPILTGRASLDPANWDLSAVPPQTRQDMLVLGWYLWSKLQPDNLDKLLENAAKPLSAFSVPPKLMQEIARGLSAALRTQTGWNLAFSSADLLSMTPIQFVNFLHSWKLLNYKRQPETIADELLYGEALTE